MSEKGKARRAKYEKKQAENGAKVINWIIGVLILCAVLYLIYFSVYS